jgi:hypothetical protein
MRIILVAVLLVVLAATSSFAGVGYTATNDISAADNAAKTFAGRAILPHDGLGVLGPQIGKLSTGVSIAWNVLPISYAIKTVHASGVRAFGTASDSTAITWIAVAKGGAVPAPTQPNVMGVLTTGWSVM